MSLDNLKQVIYGSSNTGSEPMIRVGLLLPLCLEKKKN